MFYRFTCYRRFNWEYKFDILLLLKNYSDFINMMIIMYVHNNASTIAPKNDRA